MILGQYAHIIDNFYPDPLAVRNEILKTATWSTRMRRYSGFNSLESFQDVFVKTKIESFLKVNITSRFFGTTRTTPYRKDWISNYIHTDGGTWVGVLYLNPNPPKENGTLVFRNKVTGSIQAEDEVGTTPEGTNDLNKWDIVFNCEGIFNRLFILRSNVWHGSLPKNGFGETLENSRLVQIFNWS